MLGHNAPEIPLESCLLPVGGYTLGLKEESYEKLISAIHRIRFELSISDEEYYNLLNLFNDKMTRALKKLKT